MALTGCGLELVDDPIGRRNPRDEDDWGAEEEEIAVDSNRRVNKRLASMARLPHGENSTAKSSARRHYDEINDKIRRLHPPHGRSH